LPQTQENIAWVEPGVTQPAAPVQPPAQTVTESKPPPPPQGGLSIATAPSGAKVIVDGSIVKTSPAAISNLATGRHHLQIVLPDYNTEERDVDVKDGEITSEGIITLHPLIRPQMAATTIVTADGAIKPTRKETDGEVAVSKKRTRVKPPSPPVTEKPAPTATRQVAAAPGPGTAPSAKTISKPAPAPKPSESPQRRRPEFEGSAPGG
jgi:cell division septation protein DedD